MTIRNLSASSALLIAIHPPSINGATPGQRTAFSTSGCSNMLGTRASRVSNGTANSRFFNRSPSLVCSIARYPFGKGQFLRKRHLCRDFGIQACAQKISYLRQHPRGRRRISLQNESGDGIERIEKEVWIQLIAKNTSRARTLLDLGLVARSSRSLLFARLLPLLNAEIQTAPDKENETVTTSKLQPKRARVRARSDVPK